MRQPRADERFLAEEPQGATPLHRFVAAALGLSCQPGGRVYRNSAKSDNRGPAILAAIQADPGAATVTADLRPNAEPPCHRASVGAPV
jgi:hypothetical protein